MSSSQRSGLALLAGLVAFGTGCVRSAGAESVQAPIQASATEQRVATSATADASSSFSCGSTQTIQFGPNITPDMVVANQEDADCFAWAQFISLNWPASALSADGGTQGAGFGSPGDVSPVQWQTYMSTDLLFQPDGGAPPPWGTQPAISEDCLAEANLTTEQARRLLPLMTASKFSEQFSDKSSGQAFPFSGPAWLGAQNGTNLWYDVRVSQPEYDYIVGAGLYNANNQAALVDGGAGSPVVLPAGSFSTNVGAIELKSAWMEVTHPQDARWNDYKLAPAVVADPQTQKCRTTTVALVGLHIIHKMERQPSFMWATFEHVANAPNDGADAGTTSWNFHNAQCQPQQVKVEQPAKCAADGKSTEVTVGCTPNSPPPYYIGDGCPAPVPIQVTRLTPIDQTAQKVNALVQQQIAQSYPGSVWRNYMLVNTLWSTNPSPSPEKPVKAPQPFDGAAPSSTIPIANTTMETYLQVDAPPNSRQSVSNCIACHQKASIQGDSGWASDFSFVFKLAEAPPSAPKLKKAVRAKKEQVGPPKLRRIIR